MNGKLAKERSLSLFSSVSKIDYPVFVPAKKRVRFAIHLGYPYPEKMKANPAPGDGKKYRESVEKYTMDELNNLDGFDLLDETNRYKIIFPTAWRHPNTSLAR